MLDRGLSGQIPYTALCGGLSVASFASAAVLAWHHPLAPVLVCSALLLWLAIMVWRPGIWLVVVPASLPALSFSPWTGWIAFEEFDLLLWGVVAGGYARLGLARWTAGAAPPGARTDLVCLGLAGVLGAFGIAALVRGML
ncbi:MAG: hypothetical protein KA439_11270, partial [Rhizobacter sp.]|nr:hypothetical protein [Rhizobacter sp.]